MKAEDEKKIPVKFQQLNEFIFSIDNLSKWLNYVDQLDKITMCQEVKGSFISMKINLFRKNQAFQFRIKEFEKNKKIRLKAIQPYFFEITIKTFQAVDGFSYVVLKTKTKPQGIFILFGRKKLKSKNKFSLEILEGFFSKN